MRGVSLISASVLLVIGAVSSGCTRYPLYRDGRLVVPSWFKVRFILYYPDGRRYEGDCAWPPSYDRILAWDIKANRDRVKPGTSMLSERHVRGQMVYDFIPHGRGTMTYTTGKKERGVWRNGGFLGEGAELP